MTNYTAFAIMNGCFSDTIDVPMYVQPNPIAAYNANPSPMIVSTPIDFTDASTFSASPGIFWLYDFGDGQSDASQNATHIYPNPGDYEICLVVVDQGGCTDTVCSIVPVAPAEVFIPNVITANGDGVNDILKFEYLEFYPENHLTIIDRWGVVIYETSDYQNNWDPRPYSDGTYFFRLTLTAADKEYNGFFQIVK
jgi:gliding motility-associated-like protein